MILDLGNGKQVVVQSDNRTESIRIALWAFGGHLGVDLTKQQANQLRLALADAVLRR